MKKPEPVFSPAQEPLFTKHFISYAGDQHLVWKSENSEDKNETLFLFHKLQRLVVEKLVCGAYKATNKSSTFVLTFALEYDRICAICHWWDVVYLVFNKLLFDFNVCPIYTKGSLTSVIFLCSWQNATPMKCDVHRVQ